GVEAPMISNPMQRASATRGPEPHTSNELGQCGVPCCPECSGEALQVFTTLGGQCPRCHQSWLRAEWQRGASRPDLRMEDDTGLSHDLCRRHGQEPLQQVPGARRATPRKRLEVDVTFEGDDNLYA